MVRNYKKKEKILYTEDDVKKALADLKSGKSLRSTSETFKIPYGTLRRLHQKTLIPKVYKSKKLNFNYLFSIYLPNIT